MTTTKTFHAPVDGWVRTWAASPQAADAAIGSWAGHPPLADVTLRQVLRLSGSGRRLRVRVTNRYGSGPLSLGAATVGIAVPGGAVAPESVRALSFSGSGAAAVPAGAELLSDPVDLAVTALSRLTVSLYLPDAVTSCTVHDPTSDTGWAVPGEAVAAVSLPVGSETLPVRALLSAVDVLPEGTADAVVVLGDSRVDGAGSTPDGNHSWPDLLAERLVRRGGTAVHVSNQGISGNRLLHSGIGPSGLARFGRDVLTTPGLRSVIVSLGVNDLAVSAARAEASPDLAEFLAMFPGGVVSSDDVITGYRTLIARAHAHGVSIHGTTLAPFEGDDIFTPEGDAAREEVNAWMRTSGAFDAVLDFDAVWRDPARPSRIQDGLHSGDHLHGSDAGYQALADSVDLSLFG